MTRRAMLPFRRSTRRVPSIADATCLSAVAPLIEPFGEP
jgi:hypothetical protein